MKKEFKEEGDFKIGLFGEKEFNLSEKMEEVKDRKGFEYGVIPTEDVKEFIRLLKEFCDGLLKEIKHPAPRLAIINIRNKIDKLSGDLK